MKFFKRLPVKGKELIYSSSFNNITALACDADTIIVLDQNEVVNQKKILRFREKDNKEKI